MSANSMRSGQSTESCKSEVLAANQIKESGVGELSGKKPGTWSVNPLFSAFSTSFPSRKGFANSVLDSFCESSRTPPSLVWFAGATSEQYSRSTTSVSCVSSIEFFSEGSKQNSLITGVEVVCTREWIPFELSKWWCPLLRLSEACPEVPNRQPYLCNGNGRSSCDHLGQLQNRKTLRSRKSEKNWQKKTESYFSYFSPIFPFFLYFSYFSKIFFLLTDAVATLKADLANV